MCSTLCACLMFMIFWNASVKPVRSATVKRYPDKCKIYEIYDTENNFDDAKAICEQSGGMLAQISQPTVTDNFDAPLSQFLRAHIGGNCAWIGAIDAEGDGWWYWTDGTPALSVPWTIPHAQTFQYQRYYLNCGRLCQGDSKWIWEPVGCETALKFICEYVDPDAENCVNACTIPTPSTSPTGFSGADESRLVHRGKIFKIPDSMTDFANAMNFCDRDGGHLAIIRPETGTMRLNARMSRFLQSRVGESCAYIGASDRETEGTWSWIDGTPIYSVMWTLDRFFHSIQRFKKDCGRLCSDPQTEWIYKQETCDISSKFVCEYDEPVLETTVKPVFKPKIKPVLKPKTKPVGKKVTFTVVKRLPDPKLIIGNPVLIRSASMATMCSRLCMKTDNCDQFNFNVVTHECRGYRRTSSVTYRDDPKWTVWMLEKT